MQHPFSLDVTEIRGGKIGDLLVGTK